MSIHQKSIIELIYSYRKSPSNSLPIEVKAGESKFSNQIFQKNKDLVSKSLRSLRTLLKQFQQKISNFVERSIHLIRTLWTNFRSSFNSWITHSHKLIIQLFRFFKNGLSICWKGTSNFILSCWIKTVSFFSSAKVNCKNGTIWACQSIKNGFSLFWQQTSHFSKIFWNKTAAFLNTLVSNGISGLSWIFHFLKRKAPSSSRKFLVFLSPAQIKPSLSSVQPDLAAKMGPFGPFNLFRTVFLSFGNEPLTFPKSSGTKQPLFSIH